MEQISLSLNLNHYTQRTGPNNERASIIKEFVDEINLERINTKYKPVKGKRIAIMLSVLKTEFELRQFLSECRDYKNRNGSFSRRYFGGFKSQKLSTDKVARFS